MKFFILLSCLLSLNTVLANGFKTCKGEEKFSELKSSLCTTVKSSLNYQEESAENIELFVRKFPSLEARSGSIWLIAGGPGESGASFYSLIDTYRASFPNFDIFVPDHRGTGASSAICPEESVNSLAGKNIVGQEWGTCFAHMYANTDYVRAFNITNAAKDLRSLINNMSGTGKRYIYGVSYGTQLTLRLLQLENIKVDGVILDSLVPMQDDNNFDLSKRSQVVDMVGKTLLDKCHGSVACSGKNAADLQQQLTALIKEAKSIKHFSEKLPETSLSNTLGAMLDIPAIRHEIPHIINALTQGDATALENAVTAINAYYKQFDKGYNNFGSSIPLVQVITASENNLRAEMSKADVAKEAEKLLFTSPLPTLIAENSMPTYSKDSFYATLPSKLPKVMILHGTLDPKTHYDAAKEYAHKLAKVGQISFIDVIDSPHFVALNAPTCFKTYAGKFINASKVQHELCRDENVLVKY